MLILTITVLFWWSEENYMFHFWFYTADIWKNFTQISFWLRTFKTLFLLCYPHDSKAWCNRTPSYQETTSSATSCQDTRWVGTEHGSILRSPSYTRCQEMTMAHINISSKLMLNVSLTQILLARFPKCSLSSNMRERMIDGEEAGMQRNRTQPIAIQISCFENFTKPCDHFSSRLWKGPLQMKHLKAHFSLASR